MALDDNGFKYIKSLPGIFKIVIIICSVCAFVCAMVYDADWQVEGVAFFNIMQLIILVYGVAVLIMRLTCNPNVNWSKYDGILSVMLACLEFAATSLWAPTIKTLSNISSWGVPVPYNVDALTAMVVFGYMTGIMCIVHVSYIILKV